MIAIFDSSVASLFIGLLMLRVFYSITLIWYIWPKGNYPKINRADLNVALSFGGWLAVSNIVSPMLVFFDRFVIGAMLGLVAVSYYTVPYDLILKAFVFFHGGYGCFFPALANAFSNADQLSMQKVLLTATQWLGFFWLPVLLFVMMFANQLMSLWLGDRLVNEMTAVGQILLVSVFVNGVSLILYQFIQSLGRSDITAKFHLLELPVYALVLWYAIDQWSVIGAAIAWFIRVLMDFVLLFGASYYLMLGVIRVLKFVFGLLVACIVLFTIAYMMSGNLATLVMLVMLVSLPIVVYFKLFKDRSVTEKGQIK